MDSPSEVSEEQLKELYIKVDKKERYVLGHLKCNQKNS
jgi:hypothetical protein